MRKNTFYILIVLLYLLMPICIFAALGTMVSKKFEVDESYWKIDANKNLTLEQKNEKVRRLDNQGKRMENKAAALVFIAFAAPLSATVLLVKKHKILG